jgi:hypothetical protein
MDESEFEDTPETAPMRPQSKRSVDAEKAKQLRDGPVFRNARVKFRDECARYRNPEDGTIGAACHLCGEDIDYRLQYPHPQAWELDHIKTVKEFPELVLDPLNFAASHHSCNMERGTDDPPLHLGEPSEIW